MCHWISIREAWYDIPSEIIEQSFKTCGISNDLNGVEDSENTGERDEATIVLPEDFYEDEQNQCYYLTLIDNQVGDDGGA